MKHVSLIIWLLLLGATIASAKPNVVVILTDDQGWGDLSVSGNSNLSTPNIDQLAADGASFERFFVCPVCSPTRAEFLTGRYHPRGGVYSTSAGGERLDLDEGTVADAFRAAGYATGAWGKWHNGMQYPYHPNGRGFEEFYGFCSGHWGDYYSPMLEHNGAMVRGNGFVIDDFTERAIKFIDEQHREGRPFFAYLPFNTPHSPMQVPDRWWQKFEDADLKLRSREREKEDIQHTRAALAMCENIDWNVGRVLAKLEALGIAEETIVVYFSDNGPNGWRWNGGMRGRKGSTDEGGVRSPLFVRWKGTIEAGREVEEIAGAIDLFPTLADLAGVDVEWANPADGVSLEPLLVGAQAGSWPERRLFSHWGGRVSVRTQRFRLDDKGRLYDMYEDLGQARDVAADHPVLAADLRASVGAWKQEMLPGLKDDKRPFVIGHPGAPRTQIPARDGVASGGIERSNRFPNCSYFTNWKTPDDRITWDVELAASGEYAVDIYYTCAEEDLGSKIELRFGETALTGTVTQANNPPLVGALQDHVVRAESYVKNFRPMRLGTLKMEAGAGDLVLRALEVPAASVMDFRLLMLTRVE